MKLSAHSSPIRRTTRRVHSARSLRKDLIEAISVTYGTATTPAATITGSPFSQTNRTDTNNVIARWEDEQYSLNLIRSSYGSTFGVVIFSKRLDALAQAAVTEAVRLDKEEAPQREAERQRQQEQDTRAAQEKAWLVNKPAFRPRRTSTWGNRGRVAEGHDLCQYWIYHEHVLEASLPTAALCHSR